jgi:nucleoside-diphosphate-sugar epimerase
MGRAFVAALDAPREVVHDRAFNVGTTAENYQVGELAEIVRDVIPGTTISHAEGAGPDLRCYRVDCNRIVRELPDFKPQWTARRGVEELYDVYRCEGVAVDDFEGERFKRIAHLEGLVRRGVVGSDLRRAGAERS